MHPWPSCCKQFVYNNVIYLGLGGKWGWSTIRGGSPCFCAELLLTLCKSSNCAKPNKLISLFILPSSL